jgi:hypothetical protein
MELVFIVSTVLLVVLVVVRLAESNSGAHLLSGPRGSLDAATLWVIHGVLRAYGSTADFLRHEIGTRVLHRITRAALRAARYFERRLSHLYAYLDHFRARREAARTSIGLAQIERSSKSLDTQKKGIVV